MKLSSISVLSVGLICLSVALMNGKKPIKTIEKQFQFVPSGKAIVEKDTLSVQAFKMLDHEITNGEYSVFLEDIRANDPEQLPKLEVDKEGWGKRFPDGFLKPMDELYYVHEAYRDYPVVNISQYAAKEYCKWLTTKLNESRSDDEQIIVRLPSRTEFIRAGAGSNLNFQYTWGNQYMTNSEGKFLCNFTRILYSNMSRGENDRVVIKNAGTKLDLESDGAMYTAKMKSYYPNQFELYNLNGNVAEWIAEDDCAAGGSWYDFGYDVRLQSVKTVNDPSPEVGFRPIFTVVVEK